MQADEHLAPLAQRDLMLELDVTSACFVTLRFELSDIFSHDITFLAAVVVLLGGAAGAHAQTPGSPAAANGKAIYEQRCVQCHGAGGRGDGAAAPVLIPRPRDFTSAKYKLRTTETGSLPTDDDLIRTIAHGVPGMMVWGAIFRADAHGNEAAVDARIRPSTDRTTAAIVFTVSEGTQVFVGHILVVGNVRTSTDTTRSFQP
jgi:mono/diheme cytochrome c family protein